MKKYTILAASILLPFALGTATADETQPLVSIVGQVAPMSNTELAEVKGGFADICILCALANTANVTQLNISAVSALIAQNNASAVWQSNN